MCCIDAMMMLCHDLRASENLQAGKLLDLSELVGEDMQLKWFQIKKFMREQMVVYGNKVRLSCMAHARGCRAKLVRLREHMLLLDAKHTIQIRSMLRKKGWGGLLRAGPCGCWGSAAALGQRPARSDSMQHGT